MKTKLAIGIILQLLGVASSLIVSESLDPDYGVRYAEAERNEHSDLTQKYFSSHLALMVLGYVPFGLLSMAIALPTLMRHYPSSISQKQKQALIAIIIFATIFLMTSPIHSLTNNIPLVVNFVVGLTYFLGAFGFYSMYESWRYRDKNKRWLVLVFGLMGVLIAYFTLEALFRDMYGVR